MNTANLLTIVIPVLNEETFLRDQIAEVRRIVPGAELIVVDGGSTDNTAAIADERADVVIRSAPGRAVQMNAGAKCAHGKYLLFLHVDTRLPENLDELYSRWSATSPYWGYFPVQLSGSLPMLRVIERMINLRTMITSGATGDQCQIFRSDVFAALEGFPPLPLMEDLAMSRRMRRLVPPKVFPQAVVTSSRRWEQGGIWRTILLMWFLHVIYTLGVHPRHFVRLYR